MDITGQVAIVTGSAVGVGRAVALDLARRGARVVVNYSRSEDEAKQTLADVRALGADAILCRADVSHDAEVREMVRQAAERWGTVDVLVNNAATTSFVNFNDLEGLTDEVWDRILAVNLKGAFFCCRAVAPYMQAQNRGCIVNVSSVAGIHAVGSSIAYAASKAGLINMTVALAKVLGPHGVRVNAVAPGFIETRWLQGGLGQAYDVAKQRTSERTPLRRVSTPEDVAEVIAGLITSAGFVTGQTVVIDGGASLTR
jgi:3-oxoacyl-[acyl-carrier protein] reductase